MNKIAITHSHLCSRGGSQRYVIEIANTLKDLGVDVDIYSYEYNKNTAYPELTKKLNIYAVNHCDTCGIRENRLIRGWSAIKSISKKVYSLPLVRKVIYSFGIDYILSLISTNIKAMRLSKLMIESKNHYDLVFAHEEPLSVYAAIQYKKEKHTPVYWFCYDTIEKWFIEWRGEHKSSQLRKLILQNFFFKYDRFVINKYIDKAAVLDKNMEKRYERMYGRRPVIRRGGIPNPVLGYKPENLIRKREGLVDDKIIIFVLTRFVNYRRVHDIFDMYEQLPDKIKNKIFIYINSPITDQAYYDWCINNYNSIFKSECLKVDTDYFENDSVMYSHYLSSDIFIFPNENQTWGHAPLEAMGCGVATLVSNGCGISDVLKEIDRSAIFEVGDTSDLALKIEKMVNDKSYKYKGHRQKDYVRGHLTWNKICEIYIQDFNSLLGNRCV